MEVVTDTVDDDSVPSIVSSSAASANLDILTKDIDEFSLALVTPLTSKHDGSHVRASVSLSLFCCKDLSFRYLQKYSQGKKNS